MKFNFIANYFIIVFVVFSFLMCGCRNKIEKNKISYSDTEIIGSQFKKTDQINIDI